MFTASQGTGSFILPISYHPSLCGRKVYLQALASSKKAQLLAWSPPMVASSSQAISREVPPNCTTDRRMNESLITHTLRFYLPIQQSRPLLAHRPNTLALGATSIACR